MPDFTSHAATIRAGGHIITCFASFFTPFLAAQGTLTSDPLAPFGYLNTTYTSGTYTDVFYGFEITFHDPVTGNFKGRSHVAYSSVPILAATLPIRELSAGSIDLKSGDVFKVWKEVRLHDKLVAATPLFQPDYLDYTDEGSNPPPIPCSGGAFVGWRPSGVSTIEAQMTGSTSANVDPDSTPGDLSHLWTLASGAAFHAGSSDTDADPILDLEGGWYLNQHDVTDTDNSKTVTQWPWAIVHDVNNPPHIISVDNYTGSAESGWNFSITVLKPDTTSQTEIPDGCWGALWGVEYFGDTEESFRSISPGRQNLLAVGIVRRETLKGDYSTNIHRASFEVISPLARLKELTSYSKAMVESATPDAWDKVKTLGVVRGITQIRQFYTTWGECGLDAINSPTLNDQRYPAFYVQRSNFYDQMNELLQGIDARMICDRTGRLDLHTAPPFIPLADRAAITVSFEFKPRDVLAYELVREHFDVTELYKTSGFTGGTSGNAPIFSLYPGAAPGEGINTPIRDKLICAGQDALNQRTGRYGALADMVYDTGELRYRAFVLKLTLRGAYNLFDFYQEYAVFTENLANLIRMTEPDIDLTAFLFYLQQASATYDPITGTAQTTLDWQVATNAAPGTTYTVPVVTLPNSPPVVVIPPVITPRVPPNTGQLPVRLTASAPDAAKFAYALSYDPVSGTISWTELNTGLSGSYCIWHCTDPYAYDDQYLLADDGLYFFSKLWTTPAGSWSQLADSSAIFGASGKIGCKIVMPYNVENRILIVSGNGICVSDTLGASWTQAAINGGSFTPQTALGYGTGVLDAAPTMHTHPGRIYGYTRPDGSHLNRVYLWYTDDVGISWTQHTPTYVNTDMTADRLTLEIPYARPGGALNLEDSSFYMRLMAGNSGGDTAGGVYEIVGAPGSGVGSLDGSGGYGGGGGNWRPFSNNTHNALTSFTHDANKVLFALMNNGSGGESGFAISNDSFATAGSILSVIAGGVEGQAAGNGWPMAAGVWFLFSRSGVFKMTIDDGATLFGSKPSGWGGVACAEGDLSSYIARARA